MVAFNVVRINTPACTTVIGAGAGNFNRLAGGTRVSFCIGGPWLRKTKNK
jgi:hypothetical protein